MKIYKSDNLRNVALLGHGSAGKTSLAEAMLYDSGAVNRLGRVDEGTSVSDWDDEERRRKMSINATLIPCEWRDHKLNVIDTPGYMDFVGEVVGSARVVDAAVVLVDSVGGVEVGTEQVWDYADEQNLPRLAFVNKMERENANFQRVVELGGAASAADTAVVGDEAAVERQLRSLIDAGATDIHAAIFPVGPDKRASMARTRALLATLT